MTDPLEFENHFVSESSRDSEFHVTLPCAPDHFAEFIAGLLGRPQTIKRRFQVLFALTQPDIESLHYLIVHRVTQQNDASLVQFTSVIHYHDQSSVRINSFDDFRSYNEVRPLRSVAILLSWTFLIRFRDRRHSEKQEIIVRFESPEVRTRRRSRLDAIDAFQHDEIVAFDTTGGRCGAVEVEINYTGRTWANDIDNLLKGHIETMQLQENPLLALICKRSGTIGFVVASLIFLAGLIGTNAYLDRVNLSANTRVEQVLQQEQRIDRSVVESFQIILKAQNTGILAIGLVASFVLGVIFGILTGAMTYALSKSSQVVLTSESKKRAQQTRLAHRREVARFVAILITDLVVGCVVAGLGWLVTTRVVL